MSRALVHELFHSLQERIKHRLPNRYITRLSPGQRSELETMKRDNASAPPPFKPSGIVWDNLSVLFEKRLHIDGLGPVEEQLLNHWFSALRPTHRKYYFYALWMLYTRVRDKDTYGLMERAAPSASDRAGIAIDVDGKLLSWDYLISMDSVVSIAERYPKLIHEPCVVLDLGAGWGRIGYILKTINPLVTYVICDIPVSLLVSQHYLPTVLPGEKVFRYLDSRHGDEFTHAYFSGSAGLHFLASQDLARFARNAVDLFINVASFQEMTLEQVTKYFSIIDRTTRDALYLQQRYQGDEVSRSSYPYHPRWRMAFDRDIAFAPRSFESLYFLGD
jgi:putative sugar O-methyltransferase